MLLLIAIIASSGIALYKFSYGYKDGKDASMIRYFQEKVIMSTIVEPLKDKEGKVTEFYKIPFSDGEIVINDMGKGTFTSKSGMKTEFVFKPGGRITRLMYCLYRNDLILCFDAYNGEKVWSSIARIKNSSLETAYIEKIEGCNIYALMQDRFIYFSNAASVGKFDVDKPGIAWINRDLFKKNKVSFYDKVAIYKNIAVFESTQNINGNENVIIACDKKDGSEKDPICILETMNGGEEFSYRYNKSFSLKTTCYRPLPISDFKKYLPSDMKRKIHVIERSRIPFRVDNAYAIIFTAQHMDKNGPEYNVQLTYMGGDIYNPDYFIATITKTDKNPLEGVKYKSVDVDNFNNKVYTKMIEGNVKLVHYILEKDMNPNYSYYIYDDSSNSIKSIITASNEIYCYKNGIFYRFCYNANKNMIDPKYNELMESKAISLITGK
jgi:hypothetical protein